MVDHFPFYLGLILVIVFLIMLANRIRVAYPVLLVVAGAIISFIPGIPTLKMDPELIFIVFLPPLLYEGAWSISWKELWRWRRIVGSFAFVVVFLNALLVAWFANMFIPGFSLALGFLLGGIVSPPDAVSANAILRFVTIPKRLSSILEGESLLNDASSLIIFRFALIAIGTGQFVWTEAAVSFGWMLVSGIGIGLAIGWIFMKAHKYLPTDANMDIILTIVTPYIMYIAAEEVHSSGILAVVSGGLLLSNNSHRFLSSTARLRGVNVWESFVFVLNGIVFILIGLALPEITAGLKEEGISFGTAIGYGLLVTAVLIIVRIISAFGAVVTTLIMRNFITVADSRNPGWRGPLILSWAGMRGVVSLAAALSIPEYLNNGQPFPERNLILFITFIVILTTLLLQGLTLPILIKKMKLPVFDDYRPDEEADDLIRKELAKRSLDHINTHFGFQLSTDPFLQKITDKWKGTSNVDTDTAMPDDSKKVYREILKHQRKWLMKQNATDKKIDEDIIRKHMRLIDIEEEKLKYL